MPRDLNFAQALKQDTNKHDHCCCGGGCCDGHVLRIGVLQKDSGVNIDAVLTDLYALRKKLDDIIDGFVELADDEDED